MENEVEIWKDVVGYEGFYKISNLGSLYSIVNDSILDKKYTIHGYERQYLKSTKTKGKLYCVHHLVIRAFIDSNFIHSRTLVSDHINRIRHDNRACNLRIVSQRDNCINKERTLMLGVKKKGNCYFTQIRLGDEIYYLGSFDSEIKAHNKYMEAYCAIKNGTFNYKKLKEKQKRGYSIYKGVTYVKNTKKWSARAKIGLITKYIGVFNTEKDAYNAILNIEGRIE